jgi:fermentation-respiration switch protein FrsA (DUF1100 family)
MAHGLSGTRDGGLDGFAEGFARAGLDVLVFDYRHFGASSGAPRQLASAARQLEDYRAAIRTARALDRIDANRIVLWGFSFSAGHVLRLACEDRRVAALVALAPAWDGFAQSLSVLRRDGPVQLARLSRLAIRDIAAAIKRRPPVTIPVSGQPGDIAMLTAPGAYVSMKALGGLAWQNEVCARFLMEVMAYRPARRAAGLNRPMLVQIADADLNSPPRAAITVAKRARAEVRHYPCDHFDVFTVPRWHQAAVDHQIGFMRRWLVTAATSGGRGTGGLDGGLTSASA